jgi:DNA-binding transcriptional ArsR family regulator
MAEENETVLEEFLPFFKVLADANRLKIIGLLARQELSVEQLAGLLNLRPSTVSHHLARLAEAGLVSARAESYYNFYRLEDQALEEMARRLLQRGNPPAGAAPPGLDAYDRKVIRDYSLPDGRLKALPAQRKKLEAILRHILGAFEPGVRYSEKEVNQILARYYADTATLRRELVGYQMLSRKGGGGEYWRTEDKNGPND